MCVCVCACVCVCVSRRKTETIVTVGARLMVKHMALLQLSLYITVHPLTRTPNLDRKDHYRCSAAAFAPSLVEKYGSQASYTLYHIQLSTDLYVLLLERLCIRSLWLPHDHRLYIAVLLSAAVGPLVCVEMTY